MSWNRSSRFRPISHRTRIAALLAALILLSCGGDQPAGPDDSPSAAATADRDQPPLPPLGDGSRIAFIGDSLATAGERPYPVRLADHLPPGVEIVNLSEPGTTSADWLPGSPLFDERLAPAIADADLVLTTLGGNDLERALGGVDGFDSLARARDPGAAARLARALNRVSQNLRATFDAIRAADPRTAIVYVTYPDYSASTRWQQAGGRAGTLGLRAGLAALVRAARSAGPDQLADLRRATGEVADRAIADEYLTEEGHELYARELAELLPAP